MSKVLDGFLKAAGSSGGEPGFITPRADRIFSKALKLDGTAKEKAMGDWGKLVKRHALHRPQKPTTLGGKLKLFGHRMAQRTATPRMFIRDVAMQTMTNMHNWSSM